MIYTVTGPVRKEELGATLSHEHLYWNSEYVEEMYFERKYDEERLERLYNVLLPVFCKLYQVGCGAVAETSMPGGGQNLKLMQKLSKASGVKLIANTGMIFSNHVYQIHQAAFEKELAERWIKDFKDGLDVIDDIVIRPSHIKIFLSRGKLPEVDKKMLKAAAMASKETGMPIHCHIVEAKTAEEAILLLDDESFDFSKFLWAHAGYEANQAVIEKAAAKGMWLGFDIIKANADNYAKYCTLIRNAIAAGYYDKILLSQDYDFYEEASEHADQHPCASLFTDFIPYCEAHGIKRKDMMDILTHNPANYFDI